MTARCGSPGATRIAWLVGLRTVAEPHFAFTTTRSRRAQYPALNRADAPLLPSPPAQVADLTFERRQHVTLCLLAGPRHNN